LLPVFIRALGKPFGLPGKPFGSVVVSVPESITLVSASRWPAVEDDRLTWILESVPVGSMELLFNATVPSSNRVDHVELGVAATYQAADGGVVRVETKPSSFSLLPLPSGPRVWPLQVGMVLAVLAFVGRSLFLPQGPIGSARTRAPGAEEVFLLHRSGILLKHFSSDPTRGIDSDILGGMLAAVRMFVEDSMHPSAGPLQEIRFRGGSIVFVTGKNAAVAALNARGNHTLFTHRARGILRDFERRNGDALTNFDGVAGAWTGSTPCWAGSPRDGSVPDAGDRTRPGGCPPAVTARVTAKRLLTRRPDPCRGIVGHRVVPLSRSAPESGLSRRDPYDVLSRLASRVTSRRDLTLEDVPRQ